MQIIDANNSILGRLSTHLAKQLLDGEEIVVVNAERAVVTGSKENILQNYKEKHLRGSARKGPHFPRMPDRILRRTVRGMLPMKTSHGKDAYKRLHVYMGIPGELSNKEIKTVDSAKNQKVTGYLTLTEISIALGAKL